MTGGCRFDSGGGRDEYIYVSGYGFENPSNRPNRNMIRIYANAIGYSLLVFLLLQNVTPHMAVAMFRLSHPTVRIYNDSFLASETLIEQINILSSVVCYGVTMLMLFAVLRMPARCVFPSCKTSAGVLVPSVGVVLGSSAIGSGVSLLLSFLFSFAGLSPSGPGIPAAGSLRLLLLTLISSALLPALCEELLFRGIILQSLRRFGDIFALIVTTLLFAMLHRNLVQLPNALITGMVLGFLVLRTGSLRVAVVCHFVNNAIPVLLQAAAEGREGGFPGGIYLVMSACYLLCGLAGLLFLYIRRPAMFRPLSGEGKAERYKYRSFFSSLPMAVLLGTLTVLIALNLFA